MTEQEFAEMVVVELKERSAMTFCLSQRKYKKFKSFFLKKAKKHTQWDKWQRRSEFDRFCRAFKVKIQSDEVNTNISN